MTKQEFQQQVYKEGWRAGLKQLGSEPPPKYKKGGRAYHRWNLGWLAGNRARCLVAQNRVLREMEWEHEEQEAAKRGYQLISVEDLRR